MFTVDVTNNSPHPYRETLSWTLIAAGATESVSVADSDKLAANIAQWNSIMGYTAIEMDVTGGCDESGDVTNNVSALALTQAGGSHDIDISSITKRNIQIKIESAGAPTTGTLAVYVRARGTTTWNILKDSFGAPLSVSMVSPDLLSVTNCNIDAVRVVPSSFNGSTYDVYISGM